jgi:hypothetical protein
MTTTETPHGESAVADWVNQAKSEHLELLVRAAGHFVSEGTDAVTKDDLLFIFRDDIEVPFNPAFQIYQNGRNLVSV